MKVPAMETIAISSDSVSTEKRTGSELWRGQLQDRIWCVGIKEIVLGVESVPNLRASGNQRQLDPR